MSVTHNAPVRRAATLSSLALLPLILLAGCGGDEPAKGAGEPPTKAADGDSDGAGDAGAAPEQGGGPKPGEGDFVAYTESIGDTGVTFDMVPIPGGTFVMGSPADEQGRNEDEGPQVEVRVSPFWMAKVETTWTVYGTWGTDDDRPQSKKPDGYARPTPEYMDMSFNMGRDGFPATCMSHVAARQYCRWLSEQTGHFYRLPTEAEWEYACRAGTTTPWSVGDDPAKLGEVAWYADNCARELESGASPEPAYHKVGTLAANAFGLHDMHGNVAEWVMDPYVADAYSAGVAGAPRVNPMVSLVRDKRGRAKRYPHVCRGGSWKSSALEARSAARLASDFSWNDRDPQIPKSWWYLTDGQHVGFRVVRPLREPNEAERERFEKP